MENDVNYYWKLIVYFLANFILMFLIAFRVFKRQPILLFEFCYLI